MSAWNWLSDHLQAWMSSAWAAAVVGRLAWHTRLVQKGERRFFSIELLFEIPIVIFTYLIGTGIVAYFGWTGPLAGAAVSVVAYLGPGGLQALAQRYVAAQTGGRTDD